MGYANESGYTPATITEIMTSIMGNLNTQFGTSYTYDTFVGTNFFKYYYGLAQRMQENEVKTSEIFLKLQQYFTITNDRISRPLVTNPGIIEKFKTEGYVISIKKPIDADAGKIYICVDTDNSADDYDDVKLELCTLVKDCTAGGIVSQGSEVETIVLTNGQAFDYKFNLPNRIAILLRLTLTLSENNQVLIASPEDTKVKLLHNIQANYALGKNFEPERYFGVNDAPWAADVLLEWSTDAGANWESTIFDANYNDLYTFGLADITLVED